MTFLFDLFFALAFLSGVMVIQARNPVHSVLFLILVFFNGAALLLLLGLDFFALILLVVYVGAIAVLFLFVVMMLNIKLAEIDEKKLRYLPLGGLVGFLFLFETSLILDADLMPFLHLLKTTSHLSFDNFFLFEGQETSLPPHLEWSFLIKTLTNIESVGYLLYTYYFIFFLIASLILLVAMIGAIVLTMHKSVFVKRQQVFVQNSREYGKSVVKTTFQLQ
jgi:NADH-ubiquinone oxidoreductase chain 6